jgi:hypothetical protein
MKITLKEGGNVFKDAQGQDVSQRIAQSDVGPTVQWLEALTGLDLTLDKSPRDQLPIKWLGTTGRKESSGDLDLLVNANEIDKDELESRLEAWLAHHGVDEQQMHGRLGWIVKTGNSVHFRTPINGDPANGFVQTDFMFFDKPSWSQFVLSSDPASAYKGALRNIMLNSMAKAQGYKLNQNAGIQDRATNQIISDDPNQVAKMLLNPQATQDDLYSVESIMAALKNDPKKEAKIADFRAHMEREGVPFDQPVQESDVSFIARLRDRIVNQGMTPLVEQEQTSVYSLYEAKDPRIPHLEDLVFKSGTKGIDQAVKIVNDSATNTREYVTIKWDGKPAVFFGRKPDGTFVLTDKSGLGAVGYDGMATSPGMIRDIMAMRDRASAAKGKPADRSGLAKTYADIWPYFEAATPENFRGYIKGDLLYYPENMYVEEAGNFVFQPNEVLYRIPVNSDLGQQIQGTQVGIAIHTELESPDSAEQPIDPKRELLPVQGLMMSKPTVKTLQSIQPGTGLIKQINSIKRTHGAAINTLFNPNELKAMQITDLPALCERFINSLVGTDFSNATPAAFGKWLQANVTPRKFQNIIEYLNSPRSNINGMAAAFTAWNLLHQLKTDILQQLDLQQPGQEGWVMATPAGRAKAVNRMAGGFTAANRARNNPIPNT